MIQLEQRTLGRSGLVASLLLRIETYFMYQSVVVMP
jgi:hypothetical protein